MLCPKGQGKEPQWPSGRGHLYEVEGLGAAFILFTALIKFSLDLKKRIAVIRDFRPYNNIAHIFKGCRDLGPSRNFPYPCIAFAVRQNYDVAGKYGA